ncbi:MAG: prolipoprotein diacylglyceryl transferase [Bacilli bacterium]|nr:prolipoprotein diacylglyceryl transferase [Bacilli bacterium]
MVINYINFPIYKILIGLSVTIGALYIYLSLKNENISNKRIIIFFILFFIFAIFTGKLYTYIINGGKISFLKVSLTAYGGLIGVIIAAFIYEKIFYSNGKIIKHTIISLPLIYSFTKIACFFTGCCYGIPYSGPLSITYPHVMNKSLFPIQLLEVFVFFGIFIFCNYYYKKKNITYVTLILISIFKFLLDFFRYNHLYEFISKNQVFSIFLCVITIVFYFISKYKKKHH